MQIWVDADACPTPVREILFRAAERVGVRLTLVANQPLRAPPSPRTRTVQVKGGFDEADRYILEAMAAGDLVITADIPLAAQVIARGGQALNPRGERYTEDSIGERLAIRDLMETLRGSGLVSGGPAAFSSADRKGFADALDRLLAAAVPFHRREPPPGD